MPRHYRYAFFDVADTLLCKPGLALSIRDALANHGLDIDAEVIEAQHRLLREIVTLPDRTSRHFYRHFNRLLMFALGVLPTPALIDDIYASLRALPWKPFDDVEALLELTQPVGIISNWSAELDCQLRQHIQRPLFRVVGSEERGLRKPDPEIFRVALEGIPCDPADVVYVGDSLRLDIEPALSVGMTAVLLDRTGRCPAYPGPVVRDLYQLVPELEDGKL